MNFEEYQEELLHLKQDAIGRFEVRLLDGKITCIQPYFDGHLNLQRSYHRIMAQHGFYIDKLIETGDKYVIADLVRYFLYATTNRTLKRNRGRLQADYVRTSPRRGFAPNPT